ncbi:MAG TPA: hypothetical protein VGS19_00935 [Streptosporangiaceae bacterium]|nr:hypothetical protein [Streptosporangiaceae bacterium]
MTIPTFPSGPDFNGQAFLKLAAQNHTHLNVVNVMAMDYYGTWDHAGASMGAYALQAAKADLAFLKKVFPGAGPGMVGVTPMIGHNDDAAEVFSESNAQTLVNYAKSAGIGRLAFWSVDRDQPCSGSAQGLSQCTEISQQPLAFTKIFDQF